jgi:inhibitor of KinA sporulation pathway (predicted exonuclease)
MENKTSLSYAVMLAGAEFEGRRHDALFDARNTARIFRTVRIPEERK